MFNYFRKYICVHAFELNKLNEDENETATISNFLQLFTLHVTKKCSFNLLKTISLKIKKKTSIEAHNEGHALVHKTSESHLAELMKMNPKKIHALLIGSERFWRLQTSCT